MMTAKVPQSGTWLPWSTACILVLASLLPQLHGQPTNETNSNWNSWTDGVCSRTCGGGVVKSTRTCVDRSNKGCLGNKVKYTSCNTQDCPDDTDFRSIQCADFNQKPIKDVYYEWVPYLGDDADRCALVCSAVNGTLRQTMKDKVVDGTPCNAHGTEVCVDGTCKSVGCDRVLGSSKVEDACRICGGAGKHCKTVKKSVETTKLKNGYNDFLVIPRGATNILVKNRKDSENHFALRTNRGKFLLNAKWKLVNYSKFHRYGTTFYYINDGKTQQLSAVGPISTNLILVLVVKEKTADIEYEYSIQKEGETSTVLLRHLEPAPPAKQQPSSALKQSNDSQRVYISSEMGGPRVRLHHRKPKLTVSPPRDQEPLMLLTAKEAARGSADGVDDDGSDDDDTESDFPVDADDGDDDDHKVTNRKFAFVPIDPRLSVTDDMQGLTQYKWNYGGWTECSVSCGAGVQRRVVMCYDMYDRKNVPERCDRATRPASTKSCQVSCNIKIRWVETGWTECSETCDGGQMASIVKCMERSGDRERQVGDNLCIEQEGAARRLTKKCNEQPCERNPRPEVSCWETLYGCCPDRRTAAEGPGHAGCSTPTSCVDSHYGCCPDRVSYARGPNYAGCPGCQNTDYGCCPDGVTTAEGPNYAGCFAGTTRSDHCSLEHDRGTCSDYSQKWGYDHETRRCKQFWYGGCGGNKNRFDDERDCMEACRDHSRRTHPHTRPTPRPTRPPVTGGNVDCSAEPVAGSCSDYAQKWTYDTATGRCKQFWYGGCGGNTNRFDEERDCRIACQDRRTRPSPHYTRRPEVTARPTRAPVTGGSVHCSAEPDRGTCSDYAQKWAFDTETRRCKQFWYGGCGGNTNRFDEERDCMVACRDYRTPSVTHTHTHRTRRPTPEATRAPVTAGVVHCSAEPDRGTCSDYAQKWAFDTETRRCKQFWYGGCGGNTNRFDEERDCMVACRDYRTPSVTHTHTHRTRRPTPEVTRAPVTGDVCSLEHDRGTCSDYDQKWGYDPESRRCKQFWYGGCGGNKNRFDDERDCMIACRDHRGPVTARPTTRRRGCQDTRYGCCDDRQTAARGPDKEGCPERTCAVSRYGCCPDGVAFARGPEYEGCRVVRRGCEATQYGCCEDGVTAASGPDRYGCPERGCADSRFGCCPDGTTFARGPDYKGCRLVVGGCAGTRYGCCEDGVAAASGPDRYGCPERGCSDSRFGCCPDGTTFARGPDYKGCRLVLGGCAGTRYGCCEDGVTAASGPDRYGCPERGCSNSRFGCCPDGTTFARGPDYKGCRLVVGGCAGTRYGCCENGVTAASGPDRYGCPERGCADSRFGCCPDGTTFARGPDYKGCRLVLGGCAGTRYGCCADGVTAARGQDRLGCPERQTCSDSRYGCCPDGVRSAHGPNYHGCEPRHVTESDCTSNKDSGTCRDHAIKWFFDRASSSCQQFWYGGCGGNGNRYDTEEDCRRKCHHRVGSHVALTTPSVADDVCKLPKAVGNCRARKLRWYFDHETVSCQKFHYTGCHGNGNNFISEQQCVHRCFAPNPIIQFTVPPNEKELSRDPLVVCHLGVDAGACDDQFAMWYYDAQEGECKPFNYTGCYGNSNRYKTKQSCEALCNRDTVCNFPEAYGQCNSKLRRYRYDEVQKDCIPFRYSGCNGNANNFHTAEACRKKCGVISEVPTTTVSPDDPTEIEVCSLEPSSPDCPDDLALNDTMKVWYYDTPYAVCQPFNYSGCAGNENRFLTLEECTQTCNPNRICQLKQDSGTCYAYSKQWFFNMASKQCEEFAYGGCGGNANRFATLETCQKACQPFLGKPTVPIKKEKPTDVCSLLEKPVLCDAIGPSWYYNMTSGTCQKAPPGYCLSNRNSFKTKEACKYLCDPKILCQMPAEPGLCYAYMPHYFYNKDTKLCERFVYGGCGGNANRFPTVDSCMAVCKPKEEKLPLTPSDICSLPRETGICYAYSDQYYFDMVTRTCEEFVYGGCGGNPNRFPTLQDCQKFCSHFIVKPFSTTATATTTITTTVLSSPAPADICFQPKESGICLAHLKQYYFNMVTRQCDEFIYGGCGGNTNRFHSLQECKQFCSPFIIKVPFSTTPSPSVPPIDVCLLPKKKGHCYAYIEQFFYNALKGKCEMFVYGGCAGNANRFATYEECRLRCGSPIDRTTPFILFTTPTTTMTTTELRVVSSRYCHLKEEVGSCTDIMFKWYYDMAEGRCKKFLYSGCGGNNNRYNSKEECEKICQPKDMCSLPKETGICYAYSEQYYFNMVTRQCEKFVYGGCGGNVNRFASIYRCEQLCSAFVVKPITTTPTTTTIWAPTVPKNVCQLPKEPGNCYSYSEQYFFNSKLGRCERFVYGGCGGNANRFATFLECRNKCEPKTLQPSFTFPTPSRPKPVPTDNQTKPMPKPEVCHLQKIVGPCSYRTTAWYHDSLQGVCSQFKYSGCGGNQNNFKTKEECERACKPEKDLCDLPRNTGRCLNVTRRWHFSKKENKCIRFAYTGCGGNANNFETEDECRKACKAPGESAKDVCHFAKKIGSCKGAIPSWHYDMPVGQCRKFLYGGCEGNKNRFTTKYECEAICNKNDICRLPEDSGICYAYSTAYFYDSNMKKCKKFVYGGCGGNANRFPTMADCYNLCGPNATTPRNQTGPIIPGPILVKQPMKCKLPASTGSCQDIRRMWYYDHVKEQCDQFFYSGCGGNGNRFQSELECLASCRVKSRPEILAPTISPVPPFLTVTPSSNIIKLGVDLKKKVVLQCGEAVGYSVTWSHNGKDIFADNRHDIQGWELVIHDVDYKDVGLYTCRRNDDITDTPLERYQLNIKVPVTISDDQKTFVVPANQSVTIPCQAHGIPKPRTMWWREGKKLHNNNNNNYQIFKNGTLFIVHLTPHRTGLYRCTASNGYKETASRTVKVELQNSLQLIIDKNLSRFHEGDTIELKCHTNGYPYTELQWYHKNYPVMSQGRITANEGSLMIDRATFGDSGIYTCKGKYRNEQVGKDVRVHVLPKPNEVTDECRNVQDVLPMLQCRIIVTSQLCDQRAFRTQCCASCKKHRNVIS